mmetsp:Transcript_8603/g.13322  ORF Transcript_8603/g.13322 Transcript_8603/m.13322 type:complete len:127 (+) Transcript_8603:3-383(+)
MTAASSVCLLLETRSQSMLILANLDEEQRFCSKVALVFYWYEIGSITVMSGSMKPGLPSPQKEEAMRQRFSLFNLFHGTFLHANLPEVSQISYDFEEIDHFSMKKARNTDETAQQEILLEVWSNPI